MLALVTATRNSIATLPSTLLSVESVRSRIKLFFVDGGSTDGTVEFLQSYVSGKTHSVLLSQDGTGLYEALNQGIRAAVVDPDVTQIGMLHSDDRLIPAPFERYLSLIENRPADVFYSDIEFHDSSDTRVRTWKSGSFSRFKLNTGWMPPHTSIIVAKSVYRDLGLYNPEFGTAADYEWIVRILSQLADNVQYFPECTVSMLIGGASSESLKARLRANAMDGKVWVSNSRIQAAIIQVCKPLRKINQFWRVRSK